MTDPILDSWRKNAEEWVKIIDAKKIGSRKFTDKAIIKLISELPLSKIMDCGCGEGWLIREITKMGKRGIGVDGTFELVKNAKEKGPETYYHLSYEDINKESYIDERPFDGIVFNFSLYNKEGIIDLFKSCIQILKNQGYLIIQTIHPFFLVKHKLSYQSQSISNSWEGIAGNFVDGHVWYARTLEDWCEVFKKCSLKIEAVKEVLNEEKEPVSILFVLKK